MSDQHKQEIRDDEEEQTQATHQQESHQTHQQNQNTTKTPEQTVQPNKEEQKQIAQQVHEDEKMEDKQKEQHVVEEKTMSESKKNVIDHVGISKYSSFTLDVQDDQNRQIYLRIVGNQTKGSTFSKYTAYIIKGHDKNGQIYVERRFSQFHALRVAMVHRWPGCFIPSIPTKNFMHKNDKNETIKRQRYLNDFVIKMTRLPYLYNSQQFQTFLKSKEVDTSNIYSSWSNPTNEAIINKYKQCFSDLAGKQIDSTTNSAISQFYARIKKNALLLQKYRMFAKNLALTRARFDEHFPNLTSKIFPVYEKTILAEYTNLNQNQLVYENPEQAKLNQHSAIIKQSVNKNPYWALYDMIKHEQRDGRAFIEALQARETLQSKKNSIQNKIKQNQIAVLQLMEGKTNMKSLTSKGTKQEIKYKIQVENEQLKKEKNMLMVLSDIISALIVYIEIPAYQYAKINFYHKTLKKIGGYQLNSVQIQADIWKDISTTTEKIIKNKQKSQ